MVSPIRPPMRTWAPIRSKRAAQIVSLGMRVQHAGHVVQALALVLEPLLVEAWPLEGLEQLKDDRPGLNLRRRAS